MTTVRRIYFYGMSLISFEAIVWGAVSLFRILLSGGPAGESGSMAMALSMVLVGAPVFWFHWRMVHRDRLRDPEERSSRTRAIFLYAALTVLLLPISCSLLELLDRNLVMLFGLSASNAWIGGRQSNLDNLIAMMVNLAGMAYVLAVLRADWQANGSVEHLADARRIYRYLWVLFGLALTVLGVFNLLRYLLSAFGQSAAAGVPDLSIGIALLLVGTPILYFNETAVSNSLVDPAERSSLLRLAMLYLISLAGVVGVLASTGRVLDAILRWLLGEPHHLVDFLQANSAAIGAVIPLAIMWRYYGGRLRKEALAASGQPPQAAVQRVSHYFLSTLGLAVAYAGLISLVDFLTRLIFGDAQAVSAFRTTISAAFSALVIGLPLWLANWREAQAEAARKDETGNDARRSVVRRAYLYLVLLLLALGGLVFVARFLYTFINGLLLGMGSVVWEAAARLFVALLINIILLIYHGRALREDNQQIQETLGRRYAAFPTLILADESSSEFVEALVDALERIAPGLPVAVHPIIRGAPDELMLGAKAVLMPVGLAITPPESLRLWLSEYTGRKVLVPLPSKEWSFLGVGEKRPRDLARASAQALRQMAEGEPARFMLPGNRWAITDVILGGILGTTLLTLSFYLLVSPLFQ